jgi:hypothetical protein
VFPVHNGAIARRCFGVGSRDCVLGEGTPGWGLETEDDSIARNPDRAEICGDSLLGLVVLNPQLAIDDVNVRRCNFFTAPDRCELWWSKRKSGVNA